MVGLLVFIIQSHVGLSFQPGGGTYVQNLRPALGNIHRWMFAFQKVTGIYNATYHVCFDRFLYYQLSDIFMPNFLPSNLAYAFVFLILYSYLAILMIS